MIEKETRSSVLLEILNMVRQVLSVSKLNSDLSSVNIEND